MKDGKKVITVLGAGMFGTAISNILAENGHAVYLWTRDQKQADAMHASGENKRSLPGYALHAELQVTSNLEDCVPLSEMVYVSVPSIAFRSVIRIVKPMFRSDVSLISTTKGIEADGFMLMSQILREEVPGARVGVLSGPNLAEEIAQRHPTATVVASEDKDLCTDVQQTLHTEYFRVYSSQDIYGVELAGALKNIYAIAAGLASSLGVGQNTQGMLLTRSLAEMSRFAKNMGADPLTFLGLAGVGDLMVTCSSPLSRNYQIGMLIGAGKSLTDAVKSLGKLAEGINTVRLVKHKADELNIYMPLVSGLYEILFADKSVAEVIQRLMMGDLTTDVEFETIETGIHDA
jgi:glycerol-3-phosphate dehydrogenase (NAD(P)+)